MAQNISDPNVAGPYEMYPLHLAAKYNSLESAKVLLQSKADVLCRDCKQKTPLHHAARKGHLEMLQVIICLFDTNTPTHKHTHTHAHTQRHMQTAYRVHTSGNFCRLLITFANSLDLDQARQNVRPDLDPNCLTL